MQAFNLSTQKNSGSLKAEEGVEYIVYKDGKGNPIKLLNLDHPMYAPDSGIVELEPTKYSKTANGNYRHISDVSFKQIRDRSSGFIIGIPISIDPETNKIIYESINLKGKETLDLSIPDQRAKWVCIKYSPFYTKSPNFQTGTKNAYKAVDKEEEARTYEVERKSRRKAIEIADALHGEELEEIGIMLGHDPKLMSPSMLSMLINQYVENPNKIEGRKTGAEIFMDIYNSETRIELGILKRGINAGILEDTHDRGVCYKGVTLGFNEAECLKFLRDNAPVKMSIKLQSEKSQEGTQQAMSKPTAKMDSRDAALIEQRLRIEELEAKLNASANEDVSPEEGDNELASLLSEGKQLDIKGIHMVGKNKSLAERKQLIKDKIDEVTSKVKN